MRVSRLVIVPIMAAALALVVAGCSTTTSTPTTSATSASEAPKGTFNSGNAAYDAIINGGAVADAATVDANAWAKAVKAAGVLKVGGTHTSQLFSLLDPATGKDTGFDAGLSQLLARYIIGDAKTEVTQIQTSTREEVLTSHSVNVVFATYSITPARMEKINFAGPYYTVQAGILVQASNDTIKGVEDLAGKKVATQATSTGVSLLATVAPEAIVQELPDQASCVNALQQGQVDAYVIDQSLLLNAMVGNNDFKLVGGPIGPVDSYGIGVAKDTDAKAFIDAWLQKIMDDGTWLKLWKATVQERTGTDHIPSPPAINSANNG